MFKLPFVGIVSVFIDSWHRQSGLFYFMAFIIEVNNISSNCQVAK